MPRSSDLTSAVRQWRPRRQPRLRSSSQEVAAATSKVGGSSSSGSSCSSSAGNERRRQTLAAISECGQPTPPTLRLAVAASPEFLAAMRAATNRNVQPALQVQLARASTASLITPQTSMSQFSDAGGLQQESPRQTGVQEEEEGEKRIGDRNQ